MADRCEACGGEDDLGVTDAGMACRRRIRGIRSTPTVGFYAALEMEWEAWLRETLDKMSSSRAGKLDDRTARSWECLTFESTKTAVCELFRQAIGAAEGSPEEEQ